MARALVIALAIIITAAALGLTDTRTSAFLVLVAALVMLGVAGVLTVDQLGRKL